MQCPACPQNLDVDAHMDDLGTAEARALAAKFRTTRQEAPRQRLSSLASAEPELAALRDQKVLVPCPQCATLIAKDGGCNMMSCVCGERFTWHGLELPQAGPAHVMPYAPRYARPRPRRPMRWCVQCWAEGHEAEHCPRYCSVCDLFDTGHTSAACSNFCTRCNGVVGHTVGNCGVPCMNCGKPGHEAAQCTNTSHCVRCGLAAGHLPSQCTASAKDIREPIPRRVKADDDMFGPWPAAEDWWADAEFMAEADGNMADDDDDDDDDTAAVDMTL